MKVPFIIYADMESLLKQIVTCHNDPKISSKSKINLHTACGYSLFADCLFDATKNKISYYRGKDYMKKNCEDLREHMIKIIDCEKKEMISLTDVIMLRKLVLIMMIKNFYKVRDHYHTGKYRGAAHNICHLKYVIPKVIPVVFHNGFKFDYHFIIKEFAEESEGQFQSLVENTEKHITFSVPMKKELDNGETSKYKLKFVDLDLCQVHYHVLLIILLKDFIMIDGKISLSLTTCQPKMINQFLGVLNAKKDYKKNFNKYLIEKIANT